MPTRLRPGYLSLVVLSAISVAAHPAAADEPSERPADADGRMIALFNGRDLSGWTTGSGEPVTGGWAVQDGELVRTSRGGAIYAEGEYEDFVLDFVWKIAPGVNSGVKYRVRFYEKGVYGNPGWLGCEYQIYDDAKNPGPLSSTGALYDVYPPNENKRLNPPGEYNHSRVVVDGNRIEHWLNGEKIVEVDTSSDEWKRRIAKSKFAPAEGFGQNRRGRIQLQDHGGDVWFKRITLRPLNGVSGENRAQHDPRLLGKWQSDAAKTMAFNERHVKLEDRQLQNLRQLFGRMTLQFRKTNVVAVTPAYSITTDGKTIEMEASELTSTYTVLGATDDSVAIREESPTPGGQIIESLQIWHFEGDHLWTYVGDSPLGFLHIREYFKRVE